MSVSEPPRLPPTFFVKTSVEQITTITDKGRAIPLFRYEIVVLSPAGQRIAFDTEQAQREFLRLTERKFCENTGQDLSGLVRLTEPHPGCNCHGWTFLRGEFGI